jgi:hypothetical protein
LQKNILKFMKTKFITLLLLTLTLLTSCKLDKSSDSNNESGVKKDENSFKITLDVIVKKDDDFSLFYTEDGSADFTKIEPIWMKIIGNENSQKVQYNLPGEVYPTQLRLDFGINKIQENIILNSVTLEYKGKNRVIAGAELGNYFREDDSKCQFDYKTGVITAKTVDGVRRSPSLYPHEANLGPEILKLAN